MLSKKIKLGLIGAILATSISGLGVSGNTYAAEPDAFRIAGFVPLTGAWGIVGESMRRGVTIALEERNNQVLNKPIDAKWHDTETSTQLAVQKANKALSQELHTIFGDASSGSTLSIMKITERRKIPHIITISAEDTITGKDKTRYAFRTSNSVSMENKMMGEFSVRQGVKKMYGIVADYQVGRNMWADLAKDLESKGIEVLGVDYVGIGTKDYAIVLDKAMKSGADGLVMIVVGGDVVTSLKQGGSVGLAEKMIVMGTMIMDETLGKSIGKTGSMGINSTLRYHYTQDTERNKKFVEAYLAKYNELPSQYAGESYDGMSWWLDVVESTGVWDVEKWVDAFENSVREDSVEGVKKMRGCDHQAEQVGLFGVAREGDDNQPVLMEIIDTFDADFLFAPCE